MIFCNLPTSNFFIRATFGLTVNLPLICSKKKRFNPCNAQVVRRLFFKKNIFHPSPAVVQHFLCTLLHFYRTSGGSNNFWEQPWIFACTSRPSLIQLEKKFCNFSQFVWKLFYWLISANFCNKKAIRRLLLLRLPKDSFFHPQIPLHFTWAAFLG